jgi:hypothetical protein
MDRVVVFGKKSNVTARRRVACDWRSPPGVLEVCGFQVIRTQCIAMFCWLRLIMLMCQDLGFTQILACVAQSVPCRNPWQVPLCSRVLCARIALALAWQHIAGRDDSYFWGYSIHKCGSASLHGSALTSIRWMHLKHGSPMPRRHDYNCDLICPRNFCEGHVVHLQEFVIVAPSRGDKRLQGAIVALLPKCSGCRAEHYIVPLIYKQSIAPPAPLPQYLISSTPAVLNHVCRNNTGSGPWLVSETSGGGMALSSAKATFASTVRTVQFSGNSGTFGPGLNAHNSSIHFHGPVLLADNRAGPTLGAGGAFFLQSSDATFHSTVLCNSHYSQ